MEKERTAAPPMSPDEKWVYKYVAKVLAVMFLMFAVWAILVVTFAPDLKD